MSEAPRRVSPFATAIALGATLGACASVPVPPPATPPAGPDAPPTRGMATLTLRNRARVPICYAYVRELHPGEPPNHTDRGTDVLGFEGMVRPATEREVSLTAGDYRVVLEDCDARPLMTLDHVSVGTGTSVVELRGTRTDPAPPE